MNADEEEGPRFPYAKAYGDKVRDHRYWLDLQGGAFRSKWEEMLANTPQHAIVEACVRKLLCDHGAVTSAADIPGRGGPDFMCVSRSRAFYVEATC